MEAAGYGNDIRQVRAGYGPGPILIRSGDLQRSIRVVLNQGGISASIGSDLVYAEVHQYGHRGATVIPKRSNLGIPASTQNLLMQVLVKALA